MKRNSDIWIVSEFYYLIEDFTGYYIREIAEHIAKINNVNVIITDSTYNDKKTHSFKKTEFKNGVSIFRLKSPKLDKISNFNFNYFYTN